MHSWKKRTKFQTQWFVKWFVFLNYHINIEIYRPLDGENKNRIITALICVYFPAHILIVNMKSELYWTVIIKRQCYTNLVSIYSGGACPVHFAQFDWLPSSGYPCTIHLLTKTKWLNVNFVPVAEEQSFYYKRTCDSAKHGEHRKVWFNHSLSKGRWLWNSLE
jgi:hypothetical protein